MDVWGLLAVNRLNLLTDLTQITQFVMFAGDVVMKYPVEDIL